MNIEKLTQADIETIAPLVASFRVALKSYKGIQAKADISAAIIELNEYINAHFLIYKATLDNVCIGYIVCKIDSSNIWVESLYVSEQYRRLGVASKLFKQAEELATNMGEETLFNYVHPNNDGIISFLKKHGYSVLNLIELRKPYKEETLNMEIDILNNTFDY